MKAVYLTLGLLVAVGLRAGDVRPGVSTLALADRVLTKGLAGMDLGLYPGSLLLQAMSELAMVGPDQERLRQTIAWYGKFATKQINGRGSFISYEAGGSGAAYLRYRGVADGLAPQVSDAARRMVAQQKRSSEGLLVPMRSPPEKDQVFIDIAFAVTPYLLYAGLAEGRTDYVDLAVFETVELLRILRDARTGLSHQGRGFQGLGVISADNWSRGNGWAAVGLAALVRDLPATHPKRKDVEALAREFFLAVLRQQNQAGLWHQEMTDPTSYTETSGSGLLLYGVGVMLEKGLLDRRYEANFRKGLGGLTAYVAADGSVSHTCIGCLCPGEGTKDDYRSRLWAYNDPHAFGPVVLACTQALKLGIRDVTPALRPGCFAAPENRPGKPGAYVRYNPEGGQNVAWENDRVAFRVYGPAVRSRVGSGIDVWAKSVEFPVVDKWYRLAAEGFDYHVDRGEGCDFYDVGNRRGCGGTAVWRDGRAFPSPTYATQRIVTNTPDEIEFTLGFEVWDAGGVRVSETKTVRFCRGTNFFQVVSTFEAPGVADLTVGIGVSTFGHPQLRADPTKGTLVSWEKIKPDHGALGTAVVVDSGRWAGTAEEGNDRFVLVKVRPNEPFCYYVGAGWECNRRFRTAGSWDNHVLHESGWAKLNQLYARKAPNP